MPTVRRVTAFGAARSCGLGATAHGRQGGDESQHGPPQAPPRGGGEPRRESIRAAAGAARPSSGRRSATHVAVEARAGGHDVEQECVGVAACRRSLPRHRFPLEATGRSPTTVRPRVWRRNSARLAPGAATRQRRSTAAVRFPPGVRLHWDGVPVLPFGFASCRVSRPQRAVPRWPGGYYPAPSVRSPSPVRNALGAAVMGSTPRDRRRRDFSGSESPVNSST